MRKRIVPMILSSMFGLIILFNYVFSIVGYILHWESDVLNPCYYLLVIGSYLCVIFILWYEKKDTEDYNLDSASAYLLVIMGIFRSNIGVPGEILYRIIIIILSFILLAAIRREPYKLPGTNLRSILICMVFCSLILPLSLIDSFSAGKYLAYTFTPSTLLADISQKVFFTLSFISPIEEIMYRAILWGYLRKRGWGEGKIFWCQALLFWLMHLYQIGTPITFFIVLPVAILIQSYLVRRSKQIFPAIIFHTAVDALLPFLALYFFSLFH
jgi:hypothetical protein